MPQIQKAIKTKEVQKNAKNTYTSECFFLQNHKKQDTEIFVFCVITFEPIPI